MGALFLVSSQIFKKAGHKPDSVVPYHLSGIMVTHNL